MWIPFIPFMNYHALAFWLGTPGWGDTFDAAVPLGTSPLVFDQLTYINEPIEIACMCVLLLSHSQPKDETYGSKGQRQAIVAVNGPGFDGIRVAMRNQSCSGPELGGYLCIQCFIKWMILNLVLSIGNYEGEMGRLTYLTVLNRVNTTWMVIDALKAPHMHFFLFRKIHKMLAAGKKLQSAVAYKSRVTKFVWHETRQHVQYVGYILLITLWFVTQALNHRPQDMLLLTPNASMAQ